MMIPVLVLVLANCGTLGLAGATPYNWVDDPARWPQDHRHCGGMHQSPIDICTDKVIPNPTLGNIVYTNFNTKFDTPLELVNHEGEEVQLRNFDRDITISEGGLPASLYRLEYLHFHFSSANNRGSEHDINGNFFPAELQLVFYNDDYDSYEAALHRPQGLAVLVVLFKVDNEDNDDFDPIINRLCDVAYPNYVTPVEPLAVRDLLPDNIQYFYRYRGSLTTPPCYQSVEWTIYKDLAKISEKQLNVFRRCALPDRSVYGPPSRVAIHFRPTQPMNGRLVEDNKDAWSPILCDEDNGIVKPYVIKRRFVTRGPVLRPVTCNDSRVDEWWKERSECYDDRIRHTRQTIRRVWVRPPARNGAWRQNDYLTNPNDYWPTGNGYDYWPNRNGNGQWRQGQGQGYRNRANHFPGRANWKR